MLRRSSTDRILEKRSLAGANDPVLVTGANGFIGARVVKILLDHGFRRIRCFVRSSSDLTRLLFTLREAGPSGRDAIEVVEGNLLRPEDCRRAVDQSSVIFHLAAGMEKSFAGCFMNSVLTTRCLLDAGRDSDALKRFVNVSSFAVYSLWSVRRNSIVDEAAALETCPLQRCDPYGYAKLKQEQLVQLYQQRYSVPCVTLRPGVVFGPGKRQLSGRIGIDTFGVFLHMGGSSRIPFTYVDNCAEAIVLAGLVPGIDGHAFNVVDDDVPTSRQFLRLYKRYAGWFPSVPVPYPLAYILSAGWEQYSSWSAGQLPPRFNRRRAVAEWRGYQYSNQKLKSLVGWWPRVSFEVAARTYLESLAGVTR